MTDDICTRGDTAPDVLRTSSGWYRKLAEPLPAIIAIDGVIFL